MKHLCYRHGSYDELMRTIHDTSQTSYNVACPVLCTCIPHQIGRLLFYAMRIIFILSPTAVTGERLFETLDVM